MKLDVYAIKKSKPGRFWEILLPAGKSIDSLPSNVREKIGEIKYEGTVDIALGCKFNDDTIQNIEQTGFHFWRTDVKFTDFETWAL